MVKDLSTTKYKSAFVINIFKFLIVLGLFYFIIVHGANILFVIRLRWLHQTDSIVWTLAFNEFG